MSGPDIIIQDAVEALKYLSEEEAKNLLISQGVASAKTEEILALKKESLQLAANTAVQENAAASVFSLSSAYKGLAASIGLTAKQLSAMLGFAAVVTVTIYAFQKYNQYVEEQNAAARESAQALNEQNHIFSDHISKIKELRSKLEESNLSESQAYDIKTQLYELQKSLIESYGDEAKGLQLITGEVDTQTSKLRALNREKKIAWQKENQKAINRSEKAMTTVDTIMLYNEQNLDTSEFEDQFNLIQELVSKYESDGLTLDTTYDVNNRNALAFEIQFTGDATQAEKVLNNLSKDAFELAESLGEDNNILLKNLSNISSAYSEEYAKVVIDNIDTYTQNLQANLAKADPIQIQNEFISPSDVYDDYLVAIEEYNKALATGDGIEAVQKSIMTCS